MFDLSQFQINIQRLEDKQVMLHQVKAPEFKHCAHKAANRYNL